MALRKHKKVVWIKDGKKVAPNTPGGTKKTVTSRKWYAHIRDENGKPKFVPLSTDRKAAQVMHSELVKKIERRKAGIETPEDDYAKLTLDSMINAFEKHLRAKGNSERHIDTVIPRLKTIRNGC